MSKDLIPFDPDWCIAPAATLREWTEENEGAVWTAAQARTVREVLNREPLTAGRAAVLQDATGIEAKFWLQLEHNYRARLAAGCKDVT